MDRHVSALFRPRHLLVTLLVAVMTGALGITVTANTGDDGMPAPDPWLAPFATPAPNVGDRGVYVHSQEYVERNDGYWPAEVTFQWLADTTAFNATGASIVANQLLVHWINPEPDLLVLEAGTNRELGRVQRSAENESEPGSLLIPGSSSNQTETRMDFREGRTATMWCGIRTPLQGKSIDLTQPQDDTTNCWNGPSSRAGREFAVVVHAVGGVAPHRVAVVDSFRADDLERANGWGLPHAFMRSTYVEGFPYATRVEFRSGQVGPDGYSAAYDLAGYALGVVPVALEATVVTPAPPPLVLAARTEAGPDATGFDHPYPLATAWQRAKTDLTYTDLQDWLATHPEAYIGQARFVEVTQDGQPSYHWYIVLSDGREQFAFRHIHTMGPAALPVGAFPLGVPAPTGGDSYDRLDNWEEGPYPLPSQLPAELPTIASIAQTWEALTGRDDANAYGFRFNCHDNGTACQDTSSIEAGIDRDDSIGRYTPAGGLERHIQSNLLQVGSDGSLESLQERTTTQDYNGQLDIEEPRGASPAVEPESAKLTTFTEGPSWVPTPKEAAAVGGIAMLATLAFWLWPLAKGGGIGLFSRVHKDRLLDNPLRAQLVQRIEAEPGIHHNALVRDLAKGKGAAEHHLDKLVAARLVLRHRSPGYTCYFPVGTDHRRMAASPATKADGARRILDALHNGVTGVRGIAIVTELAPSTVSHHLERLRAAGLVVGDGKSGYHAVTRSGEGAPAAA
jgi:hypothetical protein